MVIQVKDPCEKCGSFYREVGYCNICKNYQPCNEPRQPRFSLSGHATKGKNWDSKAHKYKKNGEK